MLYYLYEWWLQNVNEVSGLLSPLRVFKYITVRAFGAAGTAFILTVILGPRLISVLQRLNVGQYIRKEDAPTLGKLHAAKQGTPTMGGLLITGAVVLSCALWAMPSNIYVWLTAATMCYMSVVGFWDDYLKVIRKQNKGLGARQKLALQILWCGAITAVLIMLPETHDDVLRLMVPFIKYPVMDPMPAVIAFCFLAVIMVGSSNAVNLTDGLDGLAIGCTGSAALAYMVMSYAAGHLVFAEYLNIPYIPGAGELTVFCGALLGASLGFLWYNCHPASVFMGDTGSLGLGGAIAMVAILIKQELVLVIVGGVFVVEALSVILQVASFRLTGKRIFAMAPIHHHFEHRNWSETQVTIRFWIISIICALLGILTLKIR